MSIRLYRVGRRPDPWEYPDWSRANLDRTFGNRFDDPNGGYRVLYAASRHLGCFVETLAWYRKDLALYAALQEIAGDDDFVLPGTVPREWAGQRLIGLADADGNFADIGSVEWMAKLRMKLASFLIRMGIRDLDASVLQQTAPRSVTQQISAVVYGEGFNGIRYLSKYGQDLENWALFEPAVLHNQTAEPISPDDPELLAAFRLLDLVWG